MQKLLVIASCVALIGQLSRGADSKTNSVTHITAADAKDHIGAEAAVSGTIAEVNKAEKLVRLNFEKPFPGQPFTAVVFAAKTNLFSDLDQLKDKVVEVSGKITEYHGHPQIVIANTNQIKVLDKASGPKDTPAK